MISKFESSKDITEGFSYVSGAESQIPSEQGQHLQELKDRELTDLDGLKRDRFELLSAYLDHEATAAERRQVEEWLATDPVVQRLYIRLLKLRQTLQSAPVPTTGETPDQLAARFLSHLARRSRLLQTSATFVALAVVAAVGISPRLPFTPAEPSVAQLDRSSAGFSPMNEAPAVPAADSLMIALDRPVVDIPKAPISVPENATPSSYIHN